MMLEAEEVGIGEEKSQDGNEFIYTMIFWNSSLKQEFLEKLSSKVEEECIVSIHALTDTAPQNWEKYFTSIKTTFMEKSSVAVPSQNEPVADARKFDTVQPIKEETEVGEEAADPQMTNWEEYFTSLKKNFLDKLAIIQNEPDAPDEKEVIEVKPITEETKVDEVEVSDEAVSIQRILSENPQMGNFFCFGSFLDTSNATEQHQIETAVEKEVETVGPTEVETKLEEVKDSDEVVSIQHILRENLLMNWFFFHSYLDESSLTEPSGANEPAAYEKEVCTIEPSDEERTFGEAKVVPAEKDDKPDRTLTEVKEVVKEVVMEDDAVVVPRKKTVTKKKLRHRLWDLPIWKFVLDTYSEKEVKEEPIKCIKGTGHQTIDTADSSWWASTDDQYKECLTAIRR